MSEIIRTEKHDTRDELVFLGKEGLAYPNDERDYFTRRGNEQGQFWGHYCMTLEEAEADLEERRST